MRLSISHNSLSSSRSIVSNLIELSAEMEVALEWQPYSQAGSFKEAFKLPDTSWMPHFAQCLCFDLPYTFAGDLKLPAYFLQGSAVSIDLPVSLLEDFTLPIVL